MKTIWKATAAVFLLLMFSVVGMAQLKLGLKAGMNVNNIHQNYKESNLESETRMLLAYHVGVMADYSLSDALSIQPGLMYSRKGFSYDLKKELEGESSLEGFDRTYFDYLEVPVNVAYKFGSMQVYAGPYISAGLNGINKYDYSYKMAGTEEKEKDDYKIKPFFNKVGDKDATDDKGEFAGLDYGVNVGLGFNRGPFLISAAFTNGLGNLTPDYKSEGGLRDDFKVRNRGGNLSLTYFLGQ